MRKRAITEEVEVVRQGDPVVPVRAVTRRRPVSGSLAPSIPTRL